MKKTGKFLIVIFLTLFQFVLFGQTTTNSTDSIVVIDKGWPRTIELEKVSITFHQPQIFRWDGFRELGSWVATEITPKAQDRPSIIGAVKFKAKTETDLESRSVLIFDKEIQEVKFDDVNAELAQKIENRFKALQLSPEVISLDRMLPMVDESVFDMQGVATNTEPPTMYYSDNPNSILVIFDGKPIWAPTDVKKLQFAVNTNWPVFKYEKDESFYLLNKKMWLKAERYNAPLRPTKTLPKEFKKLVGKEGWEDLEGIVPPVETPASGPRVFLSTTPAELLLLQGPPKFRAIEGADGLKAVFNTESDLFYHSSGDQYYFLISGRWFRSASLDGPWTFATTDLPEAFSKIPEEGDWGHVLSSVPGTTQAQEAAIQAMIPTTAQLSRETKAPEVKYDGEPKFTPIEETGMSYASNSQYDVVHYDDKYYLCYQGAWFVSAYPTYGWGVCTVVPPPIYTIPPTYPVHHVSYVHCYGYTSSYVTYGYTSGYVGIHLSFGVPMYGTGYYYSPYYYYPSYGYPMYYGYPYSYGFRATYNPYTGTYGRQARVYGPYGGAGRGAAYNPATGAYARGRSAWGPYGGVGEAMAYNPRTGSRAYARTAQSGYSGATEAAGYNARTGNYGATRQGHDAYAQWGQSVVGNNDNWARTGHYTDENGTRYGFKTSEGARGAGFQGEDGNRGAIGKSKEGDLYVGQDGNVFKKEGDNWYQRDGGDWNSVTADNLSTEQKNNIQDRANDLSTEQRDNIQDRANNANQRRDNVQDRAGNLSQEQRNNVQNRTGNLSPEQRANAQNRAQNRNVGPRADRAPQQPGQSPSVSDRRGQINSQRNSGNRNYSPRSVPDRDYRSRERGNTRSGNFNNYQRAGGARGGRIRGRR